MIDLEELENLANRAGAGQWTPTYAGRTEYARVWHADGDAVCQCFDNIGHQPNAVDADDVAEFISAANPATILALIAEVRALRADAERWQTHVRLIRSKHAADVANELIRAVDNARAWRKA